MSGLLIGYAEEQDLTAQRDALGALGVPLERIYVDHGLHPAATASGRGSGRPVRAATAPRNAGLR